SLAFGEFRAVAWGVEERRHAASLQEGRGGVDVLLLFGADGDVIHAELIVVGLPFARRRREPERALPFDAHAEHLVVLVPLLPAQGLEEVPVECSIGVLDVELEMIPRRFHRLRLLVRSRLARARPRPRRVLALPVVDRRLVGIDARTRFAWRRPSRRRPTSAARFRPAGGARPRSPPPDAATRTPPP